MNMNSKVALLTVALLAPVFMNAMNAMEELGKFEAVGIVHKGPDSRYVVMNCQGQRMPLDVTPVTSVNKAEDAPKTSCFGSIQKYLPAMNKRNAYALTSAALGVVAVAPVVLGDNKYAGQLKQAQPYAVVGSVAAAYMALNNNQAPVVPASNLLEALKNEDVK